MQQIFAIFGFAFIFNVLYSLLYCLIALPLLAFKRTKKVGVWMLGCSMIVPAKAIQRACNGCRGCDDCSVWNCAAHPTGRKPPRKSRKFSPDQTKNT